MEPTIRTAHFHREHRDREAFVQGHVLGDVDRERRLAHRRPRGQHHEITRLQAGSHTIEVHEAGRHPRDVVGVVGHLLHAIEQVDHELVHSLEALLHAGAFLPDVEDLLLGFVQDLVDRLALRVEGGGGDLVAGSHQFAQDGALTHDLGVASDVGCAGHVLRQRVEVGQAAGFLGLAQVLQVLEHRDHVSGLAAVDQGGDGRIRQAVLVAVEIRIRDQVGHAVPGTVVQQEAAEHAGLRFDGMRGHAQLCDLAIAGITVTGVEVGKGVGKNGRHGVSRQTTMVRLGASFVCGQSCGKAVNQRWADRKIARCHERKSPQLAPRAFFGSSVDPASPNPWNCPFKGVTPKAAQGWTCQAVSPSTDTLTSTFTSVCRLTLTV
jgi:hypothetical protein